MWIGGDTSPTSAPTSAPTTLAPTPVPTGTPTSAPTMPTVLRLNGGLPADCVEVKRILPSAPNGFYKVKPTPSGTSVRANEEVTVPSSGANAYCRFESTNAWTLVGTFKDGASNSKWANGGYDYATSPQFDDTTSGSTYRFPLSFWNDIAAGLGNGAISFTSDVYETANSGESYCPGFWKTSCRIQDDRVALTPECSSPYKVYSSGVFSQQQYNRSQSTGFTSGTGSIEGYANANKVTASWTGTLILTGFQGGVPALGKCNKNTGAYITYAHNRGFFM